MAFCVAVPAWLFEKAVRCVSNNDFGERLLKLYDALAGHFAHEPHWWPIVTDAPQFEMIVGAVLVQQTRWETVEAAIVRMHEAGLMRPQALAAADTQALAALIRPCAFQGQKALGLQMIARYLAERYGGDVGALLRQPRAPLRAELMAMPRVGHETADTIMLYAGGHPVFIVDAYARRLLARLGLLPSFDFARAPYDTVQTLVEAAAATIVPALPVSLTEFFWNFHALIIEECIHHCLANNPRQDRPGLRRAFVDPRKCAEHCLECAGCPLRAMCASYHPRG